MAEGMESFKKVFINPIIEEEKGDEWGFNEGCLSIPKIREEVFRNEEVVISYYNENWELQEETYTGYKARIIQHEYDHVDGVLFTDHLSPLKRKLLSKKLQNITKGEIEVDYKMKFPVKRR
jgi:peptide deformylase